MTLKQTGIYTRAWRARKIHARHLCYNIDLGDRCDPDKYNLNIKKKSNSIQLI